MSVRFRRNINLLKDLYKASAKDKKKIIESASKDLVKAICECACNIIRGNVPLTTKQFNQLKKCHKQLKSLTGKSSVESKRKIIQQGGFLGLLLKPIAQLLLGGLVNR